jgi:hypothetical protein
MADHQPTYIQAHRNLLGRGQASDAQTILPFRRKYRSQIIGCGKVHRIIQAGVGPYPALEALCRTVELAEELDLQPALTGLDNLGRRLRTSQLGYPEQAHLRYEIDQPLRQAHDRANLPDRLEATPEDRRHAGHVVVERDGNLCAEDMAYPPDTGRCPLTH